MTSATGKENQKTMQRNCGDGAVQFRERVLIFFSTDSVLFYFLTLLPKHPIL